MRWRRKIFCGLKSSVAARRAGVEIWRVLHSQLVERQDPRLNRRLLNRLVPCYPWALLLGLLVILRQKRNHRSEAVIRFIGK